MENAAFCQDAEMGLKRIHVVAALCCRDGKILIARRSANGSAPLLWEFPGGKIEEGESPRQALERELSEELNLNLNLKTAIQLGDSRIIHENREILMECFYFILPPGINPETGNM